MSETAPTPTPPPRRHERGETFFYLLFGALTLLASSVPYLIGYLRTPPDHVFTGLVFNIDDSCVYLSWMNQAAHANFFQHNQFSTEPQRNILFNVFFLLLGAIMRVTTLSAVAVYHGARIVCGGLLLWAVARLLGQALTDRRARQTAFALVCVSAGFGWLWHGYDSGRGYRQPADLWQPEAITFLSLYYSGLFTAALACMVTFLRSALTVERTGRVRDAWPAAICGALLGNFHSYDVIHVFAVWIIYRLVTDIIARRLDLPRWLGLVVAGIATLPTTAYQAWAIRAEPVFYQRAIVSATWSPQVWWLLLGYGFVLLLAVSVAALPAARARFADDRALRLFAVWSVVGVAVAYIPRLAFQRKLLMGEQIPLCLLAAAALSVLVERLSGDLPKIALCTAVALTVPSNLLWMQQDIGRLDGNIGSTSHQPYLTLAQRDALYWLRDHAQPRDAVLVSPDASSHQRFPFAGLMPFLSVYVPAFGGCEVYDGHWSETAQYGSKLNAARLFFLADTPDAYRVALLRDNGIRYVLYDNRLAAGPPKAANGTPLTLKDPLTREDQPYVPVAWPPAAAGRTLPGYLHVAYANAEVTIYAVVAQ